MNRLVDKLTVDIFFLPISFLVSFSQKIRNIQILIINSCCGALWESYSFAEHVST